MTFSFTVSDQVPLWPDAAFDNDRNQVVDISDFLYFESDLWQVKDTRYDLNQDGQQDERDVDEWIARTTVFPVGDVTLDGVFDEWDLEWLSQFDLDAPATRRYGDFDADGLFTTADLTLAMQGGMAERKDEG